MTRLNLKNIFLALMTLSLLSVLGTPAVADENPLSRMDPEAIVATVNGETISREELLTAVNNRLPLYSWHGSVSDERYDQFTERALEELIDEKLFYTGAKNAGMKVEKAFTNKRIKELKKGLSKGTSLKQVLKNSNMTMADLRDDIESVVIIRRFKEKHEDKFKAESEAIVTKEYMRDYYTENQDKFIEPARLRLREIHIKADRSGGRKEWNAKRKIIDGIRAEALAGADFAELALEYSQDVYAAEGGDMGWLHEGTLSEEIEPGIQGLKKGEISKPIRTLYGYHILKLEDKTEGGIKPFEKLNMEKQKEDFIKKEYNKLYDGWKQGLRDNATIVYQIDRDEQ